MFDKDCLLEPILEFDLDCDFGTSISVIASLGLLNDELCDFGPESGLTSIIAYFLGSSSGLSV
jgi:hypothetical protein